MLSLVFLAAISKAADFKNLYNTNKMGEKRKPILTMLLNIHGKRSKVELFEKSLFEEVSFSEAKRYRLRVDGKFFPKNKKQYFSKWEFRDILFRSIHL